MKYKIETRFEGTEKLMETEAERSLMQDEDENKSQNTDIGDQHRRI